MYVLKPSWLRHDSGSGREKKAPAVCGVDFQPSLDGSVPVRLATAGEDCTVRVWSVAALDQRAVTVAEAEAEAWMGQEDKVPSGTLLATLREHTQMVNCVRWSPDGTMLATGGADMVLLVHTLSGGADRVSSNGSDLAENWQCGRSMRGHNGDITDIAWSNDSEKIVSASVDNSLIVWNAKTEQRIAKLDGHRGFVKGVAWDPTGRYIASQSDDRAIVIWRTSDWRPEKRLEKLLATVAPANSMVFFTRLTWSPCGTKLLATNAYMKPSSQVAPVFSRDSGFSEDKDHVIEFVGHTGPITATRYSPRLYRRQSTGQGSSIQAPYQCLCLGGNDRRLSIWMPGFAKPLVLINELFDEAVTDISWSSDGFRLVASSEDGTIAYIRFQDTELGGGTPVPFREQKSILSELWKGFVGSSTGGKSTEIAESADLIVQDQEANCLLSEQSPGQMPPKRAREPVMALAQQPRAAQREERLATGKRRIIPQSIQGSVGPTQSAFRAVESNHTEEAAKHVASRALDVLVEDSASRPSEQVPASSLKRKRAAPMDPKNVKIGPPMNNNSGIPRAFHILEKSSNDGPISSALEGAAIPTLIEAVPFTSDLWTLRCSHHDNVLWRVLLGGGGVCAVVGHADSVVAVGVLDASLHLFSPKSGRLLLPPMAVDSPVHILHLRQSLLLVLTVSGQCSLYDTEKFQLVCTRSAAPLLVQPRGYAEVGEAQYEDGRKADKTFAYRTNFREIVAVDITTKDEPLLMTSDGHSFVYDGNLGTWLRVADDIFALSEVFSSHALALHRGAANGILSKIHASAVMASRTLRAAPLASVDATRTTNETLSHLETLVASSAAVGSYEESSYFLVAYVTKLVADAPEDRWGGSMNRLREVCDALLCTGGEKEKRHDGLEFLGDHRRDFFEKKILPILKGNMKLQRMCKDYTEMLSEIKRRSLST